MKVIGIAGGSGSGKTTFARLMTSRLGPENVTIVPQDSYYIDQSSRFDRDGGAVNFDHPQALDWVLMAEHLRLLKSGQPIDLPVYDFATHRRKAETVYLVPKRFVIVDGILVYVPEEVRDIIDFKVFVQAREEVRFERRLKRDVAERGRTPEGVRAQYIAQVKPMHDQFVEPTARFADQIISGESDFGPDNEEIATRLTRF